MKKHSQSKSLLGVLILLIVFTALAVIIPRYYALRDVQNQIIAANENEIDLSSNVLISENKLGVMAIVNPFDNSINDLRDEINRDLSPLYNERTKILDKLVGHIEIDTSARPLIGYEVEKNRRSTQKAKENLNKAKKLKQSNKVESVRLLEKALIYIDGAWSTKYHHHTGAYLIHYDVILEDFGIEGKAETLLSYLETMYEYDRAEEHATAYYYFMLYNEEGERLLEEHIKPIAEEKKEEAINKYNEAQSVSDTTTYFEENDDQWLTDDIYLVKRALNNADSQYDKKDFYKSYIIYKEVIERANKYIEDYS